MVGPLGLNKGQLSAIDYGYEMILIAAIYSDIRMRSRRPIVFTDEQFDPDQAGADRAEAAAQPILVRCLGG